LEEKRKNTEMEITLTHLAAKAAAIALAERSQVYLECKMLMLQVERSTVLYLTRAHRQMNGRVILGGFYPADDVDISVSVNMPRDESGAARL
jgi:hypothetical protein